jgi:hypothetical protein
MAVLSTNRLKKAFWLYILVVGKIQIPGILEYASGLNFTSAAILSKIPSELLPETKIPF